MTHLRSETLKIYYYATQNILTRPYGSRFSIFGQSDYEVFQQIEWADEMARIGRDKQKAFFAFALRLIREYFVLNMKKNSMVYLNQEEKNWGKQFAPFINERNVVAFFNEFELAIKHISMNGNARIVFLDTALRMVRLIKR